MCNDVYSLRKFVSKLTHSQLADTPNYSFCKASIIINQIWTPFWQLNCDMILIPYQIWASLKTAAGMEVTFKGLFDHMYFA